MSLYLIADMETAERLEVDLVAVVRGFVSAGGRMVSLRGGSASDQDLMKVGREVAAQLGAVGGKFLVHRRVDLASWLGADGVHLPGGGLEAYQVRRLMGPSAVVGRSCHNAAEVLEYHEESDFLTLGPLFASLSKPGYGPELTVDSFREIAGAAEVGIFSLGGVLPEHCRICKEAGAAGVAVVGGILGARSPFEATERYLRALSGDLPGAKNGPGTE